MMALRRGGKSVGLPDLPYDICEYIAQLLPEEDVQKLYSINRAWYEISMAIRYKEAALSVYLTRPRDQARLKAQKTQGDLEPASLVPSSVNISPLRGNGYLNEYTAEMACRVRSFKLVFKDSTGEVQRPGAMKIKWHDEREKLKGRKAAQAMIARLTQALRQFTSRPFQPKSLKKRFTRHQSEVALEELTGFIEQLIRVNDLSITVEGFQGKVMAAAQLGSVHAHLKTTTQPFLASIWSKGIGSNLRSLTISVPMEFWGTFFQPSYHIDRLEHLGILFSKASRTNLLLRTNLEQLVRLHLMPFIQRHARTLSSLDIISPHFDCAPLFQNIQHLPFLQTVKVEECGGLMNMRREGNFHSFLQQHSETIIRVTWKFNTKDELDYDALGQDIWFDLRYHDPIPLPKLRVLELRNLTGFSDLPTPFISNMDRLLQSYRSTLTKLCLEGYNPYLDTFYDLLDSITSSVLEHFEIGTRALTRDLLSTMATKLPSLRFLRLSYHDVGRQTLVQIFQLGSGSIITYPILDFLMSNDDRRVLGTECPLHALYKHHFLQDMRSFRMQNWPIEELYLETTNKFRSEWEADGSEVNRAVLRSIPSVVIFNGLHRDRALSENGSGSALG